MHVQPILHRCELTKDATGGTGGNGLSSGGGAGGRATGGGNPEVRGFISLKISREGNSPGMGGGGLSAGGCNCGRSGSLGGASPPSDGLSGREGGVWAGEGDRIRSFGVG